MARFVHLHTHSHYTLLEALPKIDDLVAAAKQGGFEALALTDSGNLYGAIEFYKAAKAAGVKPIIGVDFYVALRGRADKESRIDNQRFRLVLLAENLTGYKNLIQLVTLSNFEGFYYKPRIDRELIERYNEGLIAISPSFSGEVVKTLTGHEPEKARDVLERYKSIFTGRFYLEITHHPEIGGHEDKMRALIQLARETETPLVAAHDVYYLEPEDKEARDIVRNIQGRMSGDGFDEEDENFSFISEKEAVKLFKDTPDALENSVKIAEMCNLELELGKWVFPALEMPDGKTPDEALREIVYGGLARRKLELTSEVEARIEYELKVIKDKGYPKYFLVVSDLLRYAHEHGILTNVRGSVAGSLVTYLAGITNVSPLEFNLPFERFLNPDRPSAPDIDMDFADNRRDEVIEYARQKYGADHVAQIGTFGTMMARGAVRDVARAMGYPHAVGDVIAKQIPMGAQGFPMTIERAKKENPDLKKLYKDDSDAKRIMDMAEAIEGNARHISVHAAGVVISPEPLTEYTALQYDTKGEEKIITQYDMYSIEEAGLLKFDFLGIRNLAIIADAFDRIKKIEGIELHIDTIPLDDRKTFEMLARGETEGTFQLNGSGMTQFLVKLKPSNIHDINAMVALYRPGPIETIPMYIERKHNPALVEYLDPRMKEYLAFSHGVIVYQDDVLLTAIKLGGYSWLEADKLRKAMGKKIPEIMQAEKEKLIKGFIEYGKLSPVLAEKIWKLIEPFAAYGFNKAHAASYGHIAYVTAYLKANFPEIYMSAVLTAESGDVETIGIMVAECKRMGIEVLPPSVNESFSQFTVPKKENETDRYKIRFGLTTIKNFGQGISTAIIEERKAHGLFKSLADFLDRVKDKNLNKKSLESLIKAGALDDLPMGNGQVAERGEMLANLDLLIGYHKEHASAPEHQDSLFSMFASGESVPTLRLMPASPASQKDKLAWEKELLGLYISGHPLDEFKEKFANKESNIKSLENCREETPCVIGGLITSVRELVTKKGDKMAFIRIEDFSGSAEAVVFPKVYEEFKQFVQPDICVAVKGKVSKRNGETSFIAEKFKLL